MRGHNANSIGVSLFGGHGSAADDHFADHFTSQQDKALRDLIKSLQMQYPTITKVSGHNQYSAKACPGFIVAEWLREVDDKPKLVPAKSGGFLEWLIKLFGGSK